MAYLYAVRKNDAAARMLKKIENAKPGAFIVLEDDEFREFGYMQPITVAVECEICRMLNEDET